MDGYHKNGLVHLSQMAPYRVEAVSDVCNVGDFVYVKVLEVVDSEEPRDQRISLSMKLVNQMDGTDLDLNNAEAQMDVRRPR
ncbi:unnamed protein product, partial [Choristocarpus tenellus]